MLTWTETRDIPVDIETLWQLFDIDQMHKIMPQVIDMEVIEEYPDRVGNKYLQKFQEGKRVMEYIVEDTAHTDEPDLKYNASQFQLTNMFEIKVNYTLEKISEDLTRFTYAGSNEGINWIGRLMLKIMPKKQNQKVVEEFMDRLERVALEDKTQF